MEIRRTFNQQVDIFDKNPFNSPAWGKQLGLFTGINLLTE